VHTTGTSRARILEAAKAEFAECGYAGSRIARIARQAGVNKQLLYYYFGSKAGLHEAACARAGAVEASPPQADTSTAPERLRHLVDRLLSRLRAHPEVVSLLVDRQRSQSGETAAREFAGNWVQELATAISDGQGQGYFGDRVNPAAVAGKVLVLCVGYLALEPILPSVAGSAAAWGGEATALLLRAIAW
jgi:TetR/AcrR family transcriptional regulator